MMPKSNPEWWNFLHTLPSTDTFMLEFVLLDQINTWQASWCRRVIPSVGISCILFLPQLHLCLNLCYWIKLSLGKPHDAEELSRVMEFLAYSSFHSYIYAWICVIGSNYHSASLMMPKSYPEWWNFLHTLPSTVTFMLELVLLDQIYTQITKFFGQEMFGSSKMLTSKRLVENDVNMTSRRKKNYVKIVILTSCTRVVLHPSCKMTFPCPGRVHGNSGRVCKK